MKRKIISLFSGAGGFDIGFAMAGFETVVAVEFDPSCCDTLRKNRPDLTVLEGDISKITSKEILEAASLKPLEVDLVIGGPPCQSFSLAGKRMGMNDPRGQLLLDFIRIVRETLPIAFVMENVKGMANWQDGAALAAVMEEISAPIVYKGKKYQYSVQNHVLNAADFGVPQNRERLFIVGNRLGKNFQFPAPTHSTETHGRDLFESRPKYKRKTVMDAIGHLPAAEQPSDVALRISLTIKDRIKNHGY